MASARIRGLLAKSRSAWDPTHPFETSWFLSPSQLFTCRLLMTVYMWILTIWGWIRIVPTGETAGEAVGMCLRWWPLTLMIYMSIAAFHTLRYRLGSLSLLDQSHPFLHAVHSFSYTMALMSPVETTAISVVSLIQQLWMGISFRHSGPFNQWQTISLCGLVPIFGLFEIVASRTNPMPFVHLLLISLIQLVRLVISYLALSKEVVAHEVVPEATAPILVFCVIWLLIYIRKRLTEPDYVGDESCQSEDQPSRKRSQDIKSEV